MLIKSSILFFLLLVFTVNSTAQKGIVFFNGTLEEALDESAKEGKPLFVHGYAIWSALCKKMNKKIYTQQVVADFYNENFINLRIDLEKGDGAKIKTDYEIEKFPTFLFFNSDKILVKKVTGYQDTKPLIQLGKEVLNAK